MPAKPVVGQVILCEIVKRVRESKERLLVNREAGIHRMSVQMDDPGIGPRLGDETEIQHIFRQFFYEIQFISQPVRNCIDIRLRDRIGINACEIPAGSGDEQASAKCPSVSESHFSFVELLLEF